MLDLTTTQYVEKFCTRVNAINELRARGRISGQINYEINGLMGQTCQVLFGERTYDHKILVHFDCCLIQLLNDKVQPMVLLRDIAQRAAKGLAIDVKRLTNLLAGPGMSEDEMKRLTRMKSALDKLAKWAKTDVPPLSKRNWDDFFGKFLLVERNK